MLPAGCIRRRAGPPPATPAARGLPALSAALGLLGLGPGPRPRERRAPPRPPPRPPPARPPVRDLLTCASSPPAPRRPPLRAAPRGAARPDPGLAARRSDGYETCSLRPFRSRQLPFLAGAARATATARPMGASACRRRARPSQWAAPPANHGRPGCGRRARGGGVGRGGAGLAGVVGAAGRGGRGPLLPRQLARGGRLQLWVLPREEGSVEAGEA